MNNRIPIFAKGKIVGCVKNGVFEKKVIGSRHFLRQPSAIALDVKSLEQAELAGAMTIIIYDKETGEEYQVTTERLRRKGFILDRKFGQQIALPITEWTRSKNVSKVPIQLRLFT